MHNRGEKKRFEKVYLEKKSDLRVTTIKSI